MERGVETLVCPRCGREGPGPLGAVCDEDGAARIERSVYDKQGERPDRIIGRVVAGRFPVVDLIGRGAYGTVYRAIQQPVGRAVALKVMNAPRDATLRARFFREARVVARLSHASTVTLFDYGEDDDGLLWMVLELIRGRTLRDVILEDAPLAPARAARLTVQILGALVEAHGAGLVHRDLKPANIMLAEEPTGDERAKVLDFGMAKVLEVQGFGDGDEATRTGLVVGTPRYLSPEQALARQVGPPTDVYALGVMLYEMLAGEPPFVAPSTFELLMLHTTAEVPRLDPALGVPAAMEAVIHQAMAKAVEDRFPDAQAMLDAVRRASRGAPTTAVKRASVAPPAATMDVAELSADALRSVARQAKRLLPDTPISEELRSNRPPSGSPARRSSAPAPSSPPRNVRRALSSGPLSPGPSTFQPPPLAPDALELSMSATHGELNAFSATDEHPVPGRGRLGLSLVAAGLVAVGLASWLLLGKSGPESDATGRAAFVAVDAGVAIAAASASDAAVAAAPDTGPPPDDLAVRAALEDAERAVTRHGADAAEAVAAAADLVQRLIGPMPNDEEKAGWNLARADLWQRLARRQADGPARQSRLRARADLVGAMTYGSREANFEYFQDAVAITRDLFGKDSAELVTFACAPAHLGDYLHRANICAIHELRAGYAQREQDPAEAARLICSGAERFVAELPNLSAQQLAQKAREKRGYGNQCAVARRAVDGP